MKKNLFIYESHYGTTKRTAEIFALLAANSKVCDVNNITVNLNLYDKVFFAVGFHGIDTASSTKELIIKNKDILLEKKIGFIGVGLSEYGSENYLKVVEDTLGRKVDYNVFIHGQVRVNNLTDVDKETLKVFLNNQNLKLIDLGLFKEEEVCDKASKLIQEINKTEKTMTDEKLQEEIDNFINSKNTCTLCTGDNDFVRGTPIEFIYNDRNFYFITEGGLKYRGIIKNKKVAITLYNEYSGFEKLKGLQMQGDVELIPLYSQEYMKVMKLKNLKEEYLNNIPINMNVLKVKINRYEFLNSDFKKEGFDVKQVLVL